MASTMTGSESTSSPELNWGAEQQKLSFPPSEDYSPDNPFQAPSHHVSAVALSSDASLLAVATGQHIRLYDATTWTAKAQLQSSSGHVHAMEFGELPSEDLDDLVLIADSSADSSFRGEHRIDVWNLDDLQATLSADAAGTVEVQPLEKVTTISGTLTTFGGSIFHPDRNSFLYLSRNDVGRVRKSEISLFDLASKSVLFTLADHTDNIMCACFSPCGQLIATTSWDSTTKLYDSKSGALLHSLGPSGRQNWACAFSSDSKQIAVVTGGATVVVYSTTPGTQDLTQVRSHDIPGHWARSVAWRPQDPHYASGTAQLAVGSMAGGNLPDGSYVPSRLSFFTVDSQGIQLVDSGDAFEIPDEKERMVEVNDIQWIQGGRKLVWRSSEGCIRVFDVETSAGWKVGPGAGDATQHGQWFKRLVVADLSQCDGATGEGSWVGCADSDGAFRAWEIPIRTS